jgi:sterol desaturase/sphingolipid hydroxylase (fatty acid hydroxylase superfamily)
MSFIEYGGHKWFLHRPTFARLFPKITVFEEIFHDHAKMHHAKYYHCFNHEPDPQGRWYAILIDLRVTAVLGLVFGVPIYFADHLTAAYLCTFIVVHTVLWNELHKEMHLAKKRWVSRTALYRYLERYHFLHHQHPGRNYNLFLPLWDTLLGTAARENETDVEVLRRIRNGEHIDRRGRPLPPKDGDH